MPALHRAEAQSASVAIALSPRRLFKRHAVTTGTARRNLFGCGKLPRLSVLAFPAFGQFTNLEGYWTGVDFQRHRTDRRRDGSLCTQALPCGCSPATLDQRRCGLPRSQSRIPNHDCLSCLFFFGGGAVLTGSAVRNPIMFRKTTSRRSADALTIS